MQSKEVDLKIQENETKQAEIRLREKEIETHKEIAKLSIEAQLSDGKNKASFFNRSETKKLIFGIVSVIAIVIVAAISMYTGNSAFVIELGKLAVAAFLGYFAGTGRNSSTKDKSLQNENE